MEINKIIGKGNTADVYEYGENKVIKLFHTGFSISAIENEYNNAMAVKDMPFNKALVYDLISYKGRKGIVYDKVEGELLLDWVLRIKDIVKCASYMKKLHSEILKNKVSGVPSYKSFLSEFISKVKIDDNIKKEALAKLKMLEDGDVLCHGDFHPGNIFVDKNEELYIIDFMNVCHGNILYDIARTVFLVEYTPAPENVPDYETLILFKKKLSELYLIGMGVTKEQIQDYLDLIILARKAECPNEHL